MWSSYQRPDLLREDYREERNVPTYDGEMQFYGKDAGYNNNHDAPPWQQQSSNPLRDRVAPGGFRGRDRERDRFNEREQNSRYAAPNANSAPLFERPTPQHADNYSNGYHHRQIDAFRSESGRNADQRDMDFRNDSSNRRGPPLQGPNDRDIDYRGPNPKDAYWSPTRERHHGAGPHPHQEEYDQQNMPPQSAQARYPPEDPNRQPLLGNAPNRGPPRHHSHRGGGSGRGGLNWYS